MPSSGAPGTENLRLVTHFLPLTVPMDWNWKPSLVLFIISTPLNRVVLRGV